MGVRNVFIGWKLARFALLFALLASVTALAGGVGAVRKQAEASMLVTGKIQVDTAGKVHSYSLDEEAKLPKGIVEMLAKVVPAWNFEPVLVDGVEVNAQTTMSIRLVANKLDDGNYVVRLRGTSFGDGGLRPEEQVRSVDLAPPSYPEPAARAGVAGTVYLLVKVDRDGKVSDVVGEQTNLRVVATEKAMEQWRRTLEKAAKGSARKWSFVPPTQGKDAKADFWVVRVPVVFSLDPPKKKPQYGAWEAYIPGPRQHNPWDDGKESASFSPDTLPPGGTYLAGAGLKLLTALPEG
jgi:TonB family protein